MRHEHLRVVDEDFQRPLSKGQYVLRVMCWTALGLGLWFTWLWLWCE